MLQYVINNDVINDDVMNNAECAINKMTPQILCVRSISGMISSCFQILNFIEGVDNNYIDPFSYCTVAVARVTF